MLIFPGWLRHRQEHRDDHMPQLKRNRPIAKLVIVNHGRWRIWNKAFLYSTVRGHWTENRLQYGYIYLYIVRVVAVSALHSLPRYMTGPRIVPCGTLQTAENTPTGTELQNRKCFLVILLPISGFKLSKSLEHNLPVSNAKNCFHEQANIEY